MDGKTARNLRSRLYERGNKIMDILIRKEDKKRLTLLETGEGFFANIDFSGEHLKNLEHNAAEKRIDMERLLHNELSCAVTRMEGMILGNE